MISIDDMMVFCMVAENQSFTLAAKNLGLGKARVSQVVTKLEKSLNTRLLNRTTRSLSLTMAGEQYYEKCRDIREIASRANTEVQSVRTEPSGVLRIAIPMGIYSFSSLLSRFLSEYPRISLEVIESDGYQNLIESKCDVAIRAALSLQDSSLYATQIGQLHDMLCASPEYLARFAPVTGVDALRGMDWISHEIVHGDKMLVLRSAEGVTQKIKHTPKVRVQSTASLKHFLLNHSGFGILPGLVIQRELERGELVRILPDVHDVTIPIYAVYLDKALMPLKVRAFLDFLKQHPAMLQ